MNKLKPYTACLTVSFDIDFEVMAGNEALAEKKIENLIEIIEDRATLDCRIAPVYDINVHRIDATLDSIVDYN